jgi:hypothetical protein
VPDPADHRKRDVHALDDDGNVLCNPRDPEAAHRADVGDLATAPGPGTAKVTCKKCLERLRRN